MEVGWFLINEVIGVLDLARRPYALVRRIVDQWRAPFTLIVGIGLGRADPIAATRRLLALGVGNRRGDPVTILLVIPLLGLLGVGVGDNSKLVVKPTLGFGSLEDTMTKPNCF